VSYKTALFSPLLAFGIGEVAYGVVFLLMSGTFRSKERPNITQAVQKESEELDFGLRSTGSVLLFYLSQCLPKFAFAESEKVLLMYFTSFEEQGVYAFVGNAGSLIARTVLHPLEEASFDMFAQDAKNQTKPGSSETKDKTQGGSPDIKEPHLFGTLLRCILLLGFCLVCLGYPSSGPIVNLLAGMFVCFVLLFIYMLRYRL